MKHRTHKDFPSYRFYSDGRIKNKTTNHFIKVKKHMKLIDAKRRSITVQKYFAELFPNLYSWQDGRGQSKPTYVPIKRRKDIPLNSLRLFKRRQIRKPTMNLLGNIIYRWVV